MREFLIEIRQSGKLSRQEIVWAESERDALRKAYDLFETEIDWRTSISVALIRE